MELFLRQSSPFTNYSASQNTDPSLGQWITSIPGLNNHSLNYIRNGYLTEDTMAQNWFREARNHMVQETINYSPSASSSATSFELDHPDVFQPKSKNFLSEKQLIYHECDKHEDASSDCCKLSSKRCDGPQNIPGHMFQFECAKNFIRKRNARERERVRCVNAGYEKLRKHLPDVPGPGDRRMAKVDILRAAISYIKSLESLLKNTEENVQI